MFRRNVLPLSLLYKTGDKGGGLYKWYRPELKREIENLNGASPRQSRKSDCKLL
jgi:hypothetical protein